MFQPAGSRISWFRRGESQMDSEAVQVIQQVIECLDRIERICRGEPVESLPGCIGYYGFPLPPNGPCETCKVKELCKRSSRQGV